MGAVGHTLSRSSACELSRSRGGEEGMSVPRVNPIGVLEYPDDYRAAPRAHSVRLRLAALVVLAAFLWVGVSATISSLGAYCLTSHAGLPLSPFGAGRHLSGS